MKTKRILALVLVVVLCTLCFAGCGKKVAKEDEVVEIIWYDRGPLTRDHDLVMEEVNKYIEPKIGARVKRIPVIWGEYNQKMSMVFASGEDFDMCLSGFDDNYHALANDGVFMDIEEVLKSHGKETYDATQKYALDAARVNGKIYGLPYIKDYASEFAFWYRKDLAEKYNFDMQSVKKLEDLEPILEKIKENEEGLYGIETPNTTLLNLFMYDQINTCAAIDFKGDPNKIINPFETEEMKETLKTLHNFYKKGYIRPQGTNENMNTWGNPDFLMVYEFLPYLDTTINATSSYERGILHFKESPTIATKNATAVMLSVSSRSKHPEKTMEFINLLNTDKHLRNLVAYGIEGKHWIADGEKNLKLPEGCASFDDTGYSTHAFTSGNKHLMRQMTGTPEDIMDKYAEFDASAAKSPALGFAFDSKPVKTEMTAIKNAYSKYIPSLLSGHDDPEVALESTIQKLKEAGLDKYLAEMQKQYDEWRKNSKQ